MSTVESNPEDVVPDVKTIDEDIGFEVISEKEAADYLKVQKRSLQTVEARIESYDSDNQQLDGVTKLDRMKTIAVSGTAVVAAWRGYGSEVVLPLLTYSGALSFKLRNLGHRPNTWTSHGSTVLMHNSRHDITEWKIKTKDIVLSAHQTRYYASDRNTVRAIYDTVEDTKYDHIILPLKMAKGAGFTGGVTVDSADAIERISNLRPTSFHAAKILTRGYFEAIASKIDSHATQKDVLMELLERLDSVSGNTFISQAVETQNLDQIAPQVKTALINMIRRAADNELDHSMSRMELVDDIPVRQKHILTNHISVNGDLQVTQRDEQMRIQDDFSMSSVAATSEELGSPEFIESLRQGKYSLLQEAYAAYKLLGNVIVFFDEEGQADEQQPIYAKRHPVITFNPANGHERNYRRARLPRKLFQSAMVAGLAIQASVLWSGVIDSFDLERSREPSHSLSGQIGLANVAVQSPLWNIDGNNVPISGYYGTEVFTRLKDGEWQKAKNENFIDLTGESIQEDIAWDVDMAEQDGIILSNGIDLRNQESIDGVVAIPLPVREGTRLEMMFVELDDEHSSDFRLRAFSDGRLVLLVDQEYSKLRLWYQLVESAEDAWSGGIRATKILTVKNPLDKEDVDTRPLALQAEEMHNHFHYDNKSPDLNDLAGLADEPSEYIDRINDIERCNCNLCATALGIQAASQPKKSKVAVVAGYINLDSGRLGGHDVSTLESDEAHSWLVDDQGNVIDGTPGQLYEEKPSNINPLAIEAGIFAVVGSFFGIRGIRRVARNRFRQKQLARPEAAIAHASINHFAYGGNTKFRKPHELQVNPEAIRQSIASLPSSTAKDYVLYGGKGLNYKQQRLARRMARWNLWGTMPPAIKPKQGIKARVRNFFFVNPEK